ncbi:MAG TPA: YueI family protein [Candidatus Ligilactobacillus excrementigallinarum]|uniref:YueI family protein n=1 Tax=Candidatus Ligilactobacillus excrementigallinarum TaxID=2838641 RepID=A0A9D1UVZ2_9LACO|nr:YueI family protein [Candidatus Ligilactobacillus excrementigallinarum]
MSDEFQNHLNKSLYGTPQINPDERRKYLGTFRERVALTITFAQLTSNQYFEALKKEMLKHPDFNLIINGNVSQTYLSKLLKLANENQISFTCNTDSDLPHDNNDFAVILTAKKQAIHQDIVDVAQLYPAEIPPAPNNSNKSKKKFSFMDLFHKK